MANEPISGLPAAAALTGSELAVVVQGGVTSQTTAQDIANLATGGGGTPGGTSGQVQYNNSGVFGGFTFSGDATVNTTSGVLTIANNVVSLAKIAHAAANSKLLGSGTAGAGANYVELTIGSGLTMTGTTLSATGGGGTPGGTNGQIQFNNAGSFAGFTMSGDATLITGTGQLTIANNAITTAKILATNVTLAKIQNAAAAQVLLGSPQGGAGASYTEITLDSTLAINFSGVLGVVGGGGITQLTGDVTAGPGTGSQAATIANNAVTLAKIAHAAANSVLVGAGSAGTGANYTEITLGTGLTMTGGVLSATGGGGSPGGSSGQLQYNNAGSFGGFTMSGDATVVPGTGVLTIANGAITNAKISTFTIAYSKLQLATQTALIGAPSGGSAQQEITLNKSMTMSSGGQLASGLLAPVFLSIPAASTSAAAAKGMVVNTFRALHIVAVWALNFSFVSGQGYQAGIVNLDPSGGFINTLGAMTLSSGTLAPGSSFQATYRFDFNTPLAVPNNSTIGIVITNFVGAGTFVLPIQEQAAFASQCPFPGLMFASIDIANSNPPTGTATTQVSGKSRNIAIEYTLD